MTNQLSIVPFAKSGFILLTIVGFVVKETQVVPLRQYIVDCQPVGDSPRYLRGLGRTATYDFAPIIDKEGITSCLLYCAGTFQMAVFIVAIKLSLREVNISH